MLIRSGVPVVLGALVLAGCGAQPSARPSSTSSSTASSSGASAATEVDGPRPRLAMTYDGGVLVLDARTGEVLLDEEREGFLRLNQIGRAHV